MSADTIIPGAGSLTISPNDAVAHALWSQGSGVPQNPQLLNRYTYVNNNPLRNTDPTGHCIFGIDMVVCLAIIGAVLVGGAASIAVDSATRYARENP